jgi:hypothetical protein
MALNCILKFLQRNFYNSLFIYFLLIVFLLLFEELFVIVYLQKGVRDMDTARLGVTHGEWLEVNCGKMPSEKHCKLVIMAPSDQEEDLLDAAVAHAIKTHGHTDSESKELRSGTRDAMETLTL